MFTWSSDLKLGIPLAFWWILYSAALYAMIRLKPISYKIPIVNVWMAYIVFNVFLAVFFYAEIYWDYKKLIQNFFVYSLPIGVYCYAQPKIISNVLRFWYKYSIILIIIILPLVDNSWYGRLLVPYTFLALFFHYIPFKNKVITVSVLLFLFIFSITARADILRFSTSFIIGLTFYGSLFKVNNFFLLKRIRQVLLYSPFVFFLLGASGTFNILNIQEELGLEDLVSTANKNGTEESLYADSRTFLYQECFYSSIKYNHVLLGRSMSRGYETLFFAGADQNLQDDNRGYERYDSEVGVLNIYTYFGIVGVILYFMLFLYSTKKAIYNSNNIFIKIVGVYVCFKWSFSWLEEYSMYEINQILLWMMIAMCFSPSFRNMNNDDFINWLKSLCGLRKK